MRRRIRDFLSVGKWFVETGFGVLDDEIEGIFEWGYFIVEVFGRF